MLVILELGQLLVRGETLRGPTTPHSDEFCLNFASERILHVQVLRQKQISKAEEQFSWSYACTFHALQNLPSYPALVSVFALPPLLKSSFPVQQLFS